MLLISLNLKAIGKFFGYIRDGFYSFLGVFKISKKLRRYLFGVNTAVLIFALFMVWFELNFGYRTYLDLFYIFLAVLFVFLLLVLKAVRKWFFDNCKNGFNLLKDILTLNFKLEKHAFVNEVYNYFTRGNNFYFWVMSVFILYGIKKVLLMFLLGHDFLQYLVQADFIFENKEIVYQRHIFYPENGFYYVGLHGWSFPLQYSLECLIDDFTVYGYGLYFQSLTLWYGFLIISLVYYKVKQELDVLFAAAVLIVMICAKGFLIAATHAHIDAYRIFFFCLAFFFTVSYINQGKSKELPLIAFLAGTSAFAHSLGVIVAVIFGFAILLFVQKNWAGKLKDALIYGIFTLLFGGLHYIIDIYYGTGWIFKEIEFY